MKPDFTVRLKGKIDLEQKKKSLDMTQGEPAKLLILFAIPMLIGGVFQLMYNMVDSIVVGQFVSLDALAAIGITNSTTMFIMFLGQSVTNAVSVIISQAEGARQETLLKKSVAHALYMVLAIGILLGLLSFFGARPMMLLLGTADSIIDNSVTYLQITCGLTIALIAYNGAASVLRAIGDSKTPLYFLIFCSLLNVALDLLFVLGLHGGVAGVAWATVISQFVSAVLCILYMLKKHPRLRPDKAAWQFDPSIIREYLRIGLPMCAQNMVLCIGMFVITGVINSFGADIAAAYTIGNKSEQLATVFFSNIAFSFSVYAGQNYGAKKYGRIGDGLKKGMLIVGGLALVSTVIMLLFTRPIASIFMNDSNQNADYVLKAAMAMIRAEASLYLVLGAIWTVNSALRGIGAVKVTLVSSMVELASKIGFSLLLPRFMDYLGIWVATPIGWVLGLIPSVIYLIRWLKNPEKYIEKTLLTESGQG